MGPGAIYVKSGDGRFYWIGPSKIEVSYQGTGATSTSLAPGTIYVSGTSFYYVAGNGLLYQFGGSTVSTGGTPGSIWISSDGQFYYTSSTGVRIRRAPN